MRKGVYRGGERGSADRETGLLRVAAYIRVSTENPEQESSYAMQEQYFIRLLEENPKWTGAGLYADYGISGTSGEKRAGFQKMLRHCREGKIDRIVTKSISRFARNTTDLLKALCMFRENGVTVWFEKENLDTALLTSDFVLTMLGAVAQEESRSISENILQSQKMRYPRGEVRNCLLYGYRYSGSLLRTESGYRFREIEIVEEEAQVVRRIFQMTAEGRRYSSIARQLNAEQIPPPRSGGAAGQRDGLGDRKRRAGEEGWTGRHISQMVRKERYTGDVLIQKTFTSDYLTHRIRKNRGEKAQYLVRGHHPAIIDHELYERVQKIAEQNSRIYGRKGANSPRPFSGRLICGECGRFFYVRNTRRPIWYCPSQALNNGKHICGMRAVYEYQLIQMLKEAAAKRFVPADRPGLTEEQAGQLCEKLERCDLEQGALCRQEMLEWLYRLPRGGQGKIRFLEGAAERYVEALVLSIKICAQGKCRVRWFDGTCTEANVLGEKGKERRA